MIIFCDEFDQDYEKEEEEEEDVALVVVVDEEVNPAHASRSRAKVPSPVLSTFTSDSNAITPVNSNTSMSASSNARIAVNPNTGVTMTATGATSTDSSNGKCSFCKNISDHQENTVTTTTVAESFSNEWQEVGSILHEHNASTVVHDYVEWLKMMDMRQGQRDEPIGVALYGIPFSRTGSPFHSIGRW
jgi:hypothetical protein